MSNQVLTQDELQQIQQIRKQTLEIASALGDLSYQEVLIGLEKERIVETTKTLREGERALLDDFSKKYGEGMINLETGEIQPRL
jgi:hypothetical protein